MNKNVADPTHRERCTSVHHIQSPQPGVTTRVAMCALAPHTDDTDHVDASGQTWKSPFPPGGGRRVGQAVVNMPRLTTLDGTLADMTLAEVNDRLIYRGLSPIPVSMGVIHGLFTIIDELRSRIGPVTRPSQCPTCQRDWTRHDPCTTHTCRDQWHDSAG
jgi:hypothetical protein